MNISIVVRRCLAIVLILMPARSVLAQDAATRAALVQTRDAVWRAYFEGDSAALMRILPEKMIAMDNDRAGIIRDAKAFTKGGGKYLGITFTNDQFFVNGNTAIIWSNYAVRLTNAKGQRSDRSGRAIELFVKQGNLWLNPHWHLDEK